MKAVEARTGNADGHRGLLRRQPAGNRPTPARNGVTRLARKSGPSGDAILVTRRREALVSTRAQERYALIPIVSTPLYAPDAPPVTIGVCVAICLGVLSAKTSSRSKLTEVKFAALAP